MTWPPQSPDLNPIEMVWDELDRRVKEKQPKSDQNMWELLQNCWKSWLRECQDCAKLSSRQRAATLKNLFNTFWVTTVHDSMCYFVVLISSLLFYNVENSKK